MEGCFISVYRSPKKKCHRHWVHSESNLQLDVLSTDLYVWFQAEFCRRAALASYARHFGSSFYGHPAGKSEEKRPSSEVSTTALCVHHLVPMSSRWFTLFHTPAFLLLVKPASNRLTDRKISSIRTYGGNCAAPTQWICLRLTKWWTVLSLAWSQSG